MRMKLDERLKMRDNTLYHKSKKTSYFLNQRKYHNTKNGIHEVQI